MAIFGTKKAGEKKATTKDAVVGKVSVSAFKNVIRRPRLTEKAANLSSSNIYTFDVDISATKHEIIRTLQKLYKVTPVKVNVANTRGKKVSLRTRRGTGTKNNMRKAYVFLKKGDSIDFAA
jgi:large subunit ribosomal protein L23